jgi:fatty acid desaturase
MGVDWRHGSRGHTVMTATLRHPVETFLTADEIAQLKRRSDAQGARALAASWAIIAASLALVALQPHPVVIVVALFLIGGQQLALAVSMHEAAHHLLFRSRAANEWAGAWLAAYPVIQDMHRYRRHHLAHHRHTGTERDPDLALASGFPVTRASFARKVLRDLSGVTGIKTLIGSALMLGGVLVYDVSGQARKADLSGVSLAARMQMLAKGLGGPVLAQLLLLAVLWGCGAAWLYLVWAAAWLTTFQLFLRIRSIAEHALTPDPYDSLNNARTTRARAWERLLYAPLNVNYHLEHHMLVAAPHWQLPRLHRLLRERGAFERPASLSPSYGAMLRAAVRQ